MSDLVAAVAAKLSGAPEELVVRSAQARAQAQGVSVDDVLAAWAGDGAVAAAAPAPEAPAAESPPPETTSELTTAEPAPEPAAAAAEPAAAPVMAPVAAAVAVVEEEPVEPGAIGDRLRGAAKLGAALGGLLGFFAVVIASPFMLSRLSTVGDPAAPAIEVSPFSTTLAFGVLSAVIGAVIALTARATGGFQSPGHVLRGRPAGTAVLGAMIGFVLGVAGMGVLTGTAAQGFDGTRLLTVRGTILWLIVGGVAYGAATAVIAQALGQPLHLADLEEDSEVVRRRLGNAVFIPLVVALVIVGFVIPFGVVLVEYASFAPWIAMLVAGLVLTFASLMASRPNLRVTRGEVLTALAGIVIVVLFLALIAAQIGGGHGDEDDHGMAPIARVL